MLALAAGFFLVAYLLAPGAIYRLTFSFYIPSKRFQRTRTEEILFSAFAVLGPFLLAGLLLLHTSLGRLPEFHSRPSKTDAYTMVFESLVSSDPKDQLELPSSDKKNFVTPQSTKESSGPVPVHASLEDAYRRILREQTRFLIWLWIFCAVEGAFLGLLVSRYGAYGDRSVRKWLCDRVLLNHVSEWQVLFTTITLPESERSKTVHVDVLCGGTLYRGRLVNWFTDQDGKLAGIFLTDAARFRKEDFDRDKVDAKEKIRDNYWTIIPGAKLYLAAASITNYNIRYVDSLQSITDKLSKELGSEVIVTQILPASSKDGTSILREVSNDEVGTGPTNA